ncbi:MAG: DegV family protein [Anaerolineae bacterium]|nr:DegV family protein [Anaerolineae bacterium]
MLKIVTDGSIDMPPEWASDYEIDVLPLYVRFGETTYVPGVNLDGARFYELVRQNSVVPKTSLPSPDQVMTFYRRIVQQGDEILSIHLASKMSGTFSTVQMAARELVNEIEIYTFDSGAGSAALAFMCREARLLHRSGVSVADILRRLEEIRQKLTVVFTVDSLEFARLSGRVNTLQSALTSMLHIKPIIVLRDGLLQMAEKVRTRQRSLERVVTFVGERVGNRLVNVAVVHAADPQTADWLAKRIRQIVNIKELILTELSIPVAANLGPGTVGIVAYPVNLVE